MYADYIRVPLILTVHSKFLFATGWAIGFSFQFAHIWSSFYEYIQSDCPVHVSGNISVATQTPIRYKSGKLFFDVRSKSLFVLSPFNTNWPYYPSNRASCQSISYTPVGHVDA